MQTSYLLSATLYQYQKEVASNYVLNKTDKSIVNSIYIYCQTLPIFAHFDHSVFHPPF
jgi:hypothetical protein